MTTTWTKRDGRQCLDDLSITPGLQPDVYRGARLELEAANERKAPASSLAKALAVLTAVCARPGDFDDAKVVLWSERLKQVLQEYPDDVAMAAIAEWPKTDGGKWWPTEKEVRDECEHRLKFRKLFAWKLAQEEALARSMQEPERVAEVNDGMQAEPLGASEKYVNALRQINPGVVDVYLSGARYGFSTIGSRYKLADIALERAAPGLLAKHGVRIVSPHAYDDRGNIVEWSR